MLILKPGKNNGIYFPDPTNPLDFMSIGNTPVHPKNAVEADIIQQTVKKDRPPLKIVTENERVTVVISGSAITITEAGYDEGNERDEHGNPGTPPIIYEGTVIVLLPNRRYTFEKSSGITFLSLV